MVPLFRHIASSPVCGSAICLFAVVFAFFADINACRSQQPLQQNEVRFVENQGQWDAHARFRARTAQSVVWVTDNSLVYDHFGARGGHVVAMEFAGSSTATLRGDSTVGSYTYIRPGKTFGARSFGSITVQRLYKGIDMAVRSESGSIRYDFIVAPFASPHSIAMRFKGVNSRDIVINDSGELSLLLSVGTVHHGKLLAYQNIDGIVHNVPCRFARNSDSTVGFELGAYNSSYALIIDPLVFSTALGGASNDVVQTLASDSIGNIYMAGYTSSPTFPTTAGAYNTLLQNGDRDAFVTKFDHTGKRMLYSTYLGGSREDSAMALAVNNKGEVVLTGATRSFDFPVTADALDPSYNGAYDIFYARLSKKGDSLLYSTLLGGEREDYATSLALRGDTVYLAGQTNSDSLPTSPTALQPRRTSAWETFLMILDMRGTTMHYSSYFGGNSVDVASGIAVSPNGTVAIAGRTSSTDLPVSANAIKKNLVSPQDAFDGFVIEFNPTSRELVYCTYLGGSNDDEQVEAISYDHNGNIIVGGWTNSADFPVTDNGFDTSAAEVPYHNGFLAVISQNSGMLAATYLGGSKGSTKIFDIAPDSTGNIFCTGITYSNSFPVTSDAFDRTYNFPSNGDAFLAYFTSELDTVLYSTYFGGSETDVGTAVCAGPYRMALIAGYTRSVDLPLLHGRPFGGATDGFAMGLSIGAALQSPNNGERACAGSEISIEWQASRLLKTVSIIATRPGEKDVVIASNIPADLKRWQWAVPADIQGGPYRIVILDENNRVLDISDTTVAVHSRPVFTQQPGDKQECPGNNVVLESNAWSIPLPSYQWQKFVGGVWTDIENETARFLTIYGLNPAVHNGLYRAKVVSQCGQVLYSDPARISNYAQPAIDVQPASIVACPNTNVTFTAHSSDPEASVQWEYRMSDTDTWKILHTETAENLTIYNVTQTQNGWEYRAIFSNLCDNRTNPARLTVHPLPAISEHPVSDTVCVGGRATFSIVTPTQEATIQWQKSSDLALWEDIPAATSTSYTTWPLAASDAGLYFRARVHRCETFAISQAAQAIIRPAPMFEISSQILDFGTLGFCTDDGIMSVMITNTGSEILTFGTPVLPSADFGIYHVPVSLAPGESDSITVRFAPTSVPVDVSSQLELPAGKCGYRIVIDLLGKKASAPVISTLNSVDFGTFPSCISGTVDTTIVVTIVNTGTVDITLHDGTIAAPFSITSSRPFPIVIQPTEVATFNLHYTLAGTVSSDRDIARFPFSTASSCSDTLKVEVRGETEQPSLSVVDTVHFPVVPSCGAGIDTVIRIVNTGKIPISIGPDALIAGEAFTVQYPSEAVVLKGGEELALPVSFRATAEGSYKGSVTFAYTPCGVSHTIEFTGVRATPHLTASTTALVFSSAVRSQTVIFTNTGNLALSLTSLDISDRDYQYTASQFLPYTLAPNESLSVLIDYTGSGNPTSALLQANSDNPCPLSVEVEFKADTLGAPKTRISIPELSHKIGEVFLLPVNIDTANVAVLRDADITSFRAVLAFNSTMMTPVDPLQRGDLLNGLHYITIEGALADRHSDTLASVLMTAALGNASFTQVEILSFLWLDDLGNAIGIPTVIFPGGLHITNVKKGQYVNPSGSPFTVGIAPVPAGETIDLTIEHIPAIVGAALEVFDATGNLVDDWTPELFVLQGSVAEGYAGTVHKNINSLAVGVYYCRLSLWNYCLVRPFVVRR